MGREGGGRWVGREVGRWVGREGGKEVCNNCVWKDE